MAFCFVRSSVEVAYELCQGLFTHCRETAAIIPFISMNTKVIFSGRSFCSGSVMCGHTLLECMEGVPCMPPALLRDIKVYDGNMPWPLVLEWRSVITKNNLVKHCRVEAEKIPIRSRSSLLVLKLDSVGHLFKKKKKKRICTMYEWCKCALF